MPEKIAISCPGCSGQLSVPSSMIGRRAKCPKCGEVFTAAYKAPNEPKTLVTFRCESCLQEFDVPFDGEYCPECTSILELAAQDGVREALRRRAVENLSLELDESNVEEEYPPTPAIKEYKVLTQKDKWFSGKFDPARLEEALNAYAEQGWVVKGVTTATIPGFGANREELIVILER